MPFRILHYSDVHLTARPLGFRPRDWFGKTATGWVNVKLLGRGRRFKNAPRVVAALLRDIRQRSPDVVVFSGDATKLAFETEFAVAAKALGVGDSTLPPTIAVPGNHDYYTRRAVRNGGFESYFAPWLEGERIAGHTYPFARKVGPLWFLGVNSSTANRNPVDASGEIGSAQLARLRELCERLPAGPRVLVTHYPLRTANGFVEPRLHRLRDHRAALQTAVECKVSLWLHGHIHRPFHLLPSAEIPFPVVCAGSATQNNRWSYCEYEWSEARLTAHRRHYHPDTDQFRDEESFEIFGLPQRFPVEV